MSGHISLSGIISRMAEHDLPDDWFREVIGPGGTYYVIKAVRRGQPLTWENDAWFVTFFTFVIRVLVEPFRAQRLRIEATEHANDGDYLVGVVHDGHWLVRVVRSEYVGSPEEVASKLDEFESAVRDGSLH